MFCSKCGANNADGAAFCSTCGAQMKKTPDTAAPQPQLQPQPQFQHQPQPQFQHQPQPQPQPQPKKHSSVGAIVLSIVLTAIIVAGLAVGAYFLFLRDGDKPSGGSSSESEKTTEAVSEKDSDKAEEQTAVEEAYNKPEKLGEKFIEAYFNFDGKGVLDLIHPNVVREAAEDEFDGDIKAFEDYFQKEFMDYIKESAQGLSISFELVEKSSLERDDFNEFADDYERRYNVEVSDVAEMVFEVRATGVIDGEEIDDSNDMEVTAVKIDGKWYIDPESTDMG